MAVVDASVYVALVYRCSKFLVGQSALVNAGEKEHATSWAWFEKSRAANEPVLAPVILLAEVAAAISRGVGEVSLARRVVERLNDAGVIELVPVTLMLAERAAMIAADYRIRGCDAIYVAVVTLDRQQLERAAAIVEVGRPII